MFFIVILFNKDSSKCLAALVTAINGKLVCIQIYCSVSLNKSHALAHNLAAITKWNEYGKKTILYSQ